MPAPERRLSARALALITSALGFMASLVAGAGACAERQTGEMECVEYLLYATPCAKENNECNLHCDAEGARDHHPSDFGGPYSVSACVPLPASGRCELCEAPAEVEAVLDAAVAEYHEAWGCPADTLAYTGGCAYRDGDQCCMELLVTSFCEDL